MPEAVASIVVTQRIVPGAPPPTPLSKSQRKKRKAAAHKNSSPDSPAEDHLQSQTPDVAETNHTSNGNHESAGAAASENGATAAEAEAVSTPLLEEVVLLKPSPIVDLIHKRLKATTKKIVRCFSFWADQLFMLRVPTDTDICVRCDGP